ncbi:F510_1955 family glycosylhydrolase [Paeniglutamicibacter gangotriensis]|uniref:Exo-alpha-sialidase n=1 Tax=Paeniglutamicibacter gangotriensis TaxID=254787 RepID=A0A5B0E3X1_9MICC|nr:exo-alpha-sialidase [Paeniglutamicibacter gangotriensis]KAA0973042.1 exo-alpha-sialidase [Paeniglutamicibacter gangotriensis]
MSFTLPKLRRTRMWTGSAIAVLATVGLAACSATPNSNADAQPPANPYGHIHAITIEESTQRVLLATHNGLFDATETVPQKIGPTIDLMGFAASSNGTFYASGHPGPGVDLPNPLGLMKSTDSGESWIPVSLQGSSDFHALTVTSDQIVGFDGILRSTVDGKEWSDVGPKSPSPYALVGSPESTVVLATTEEGVWRSVDSGDTWETPDGGPRLLTAAFADPMTVVGVTPEGSVHLSLDAGLSWEGTGTEVDQPATMGATRTADGNISVWMAMERGLVKFTYDGTTLTEETS